MSTNYETNAAAYDAAIENAAEWNTFQDPADVHDSIRGRLFWMMLASIPADDFAGMLRAAQEHAGRPADL